MIDFIIFTIVYISIFVVVYAIVSFAHMFFCNHNYQKYGETHHMFMDLKTDEIGGFKRETVACVKCGKVKKGKIFDDTRER